MALPRWAQKWVRLFPNGTSLGLFKLADPKYTETDLKKSKICPIGGQSDRIWMQNLTSLVKSNSGSDTSTVFFNTSIGSYGCLRQIDRNDKFNS